jgi:hypothetical protein
MIELLNAVDVPSRAELVAHLGRDIMNALGDRSQLFQWQKELTNLAASWEPHRRSFSPLSHKNQEVADSVEIPTYVASATIQLLDRFDASNVSADAKWWAVIRRHLDLEENTQGHAKAAVHAYKVLQRAFVGYAHVSRDEARDWEKVCELANRLDDLLSILASGSFFARKWRVDELLSAANRRTN